MRTGRFAAGRKRRFSERELTERDVPRPSLSRMSAVSAALNSRRAVRAFPWLAGMILAPVALGDGGVEQRPDDFLDLRPGLRSGHFAGEQHRVVVAGDVDVPRVLERLVDAIARRAFDAPIAEHDLERTAVGGENPTVAYRISGPSIRQGMTLAQWKHDWATVGVPIVPFPIDKVAASPFRTDLSHQKEAVLEVALVPKKGSGVASQVFFIGFGKFGKRWLVTYWGPHSPIPSHDAR